MSFQNVSSNLIVSLSLLYYDIVLWDDCHILLEMGDDVLWSSLDYVLRAVHYVVEAVWIVKSGLSLRVELCIGLPHKAMPYIEESDCPVLFESPCFIISVSVGAEATLRPGSVS